MYRYRCARHDDVTAGPPDADAATTAADRRRAKSESADPFPPHLIQVIVYELAEGAVYSRPLSFPLWLLLATSSQTDSSQTDAGLCEAPLAQAHNPARARLILTPLVWLCRFFFSKSGSYFFSSPLFRPVRFAIGGTRRRPRVSPCSDPGEDPVPPAKASDRRVARESLVHALGDQRSAAASLIPVPAFFLLAQQERGATARGPPTRRRAGVRIAVGRWLESRVNSVSGARQQWPTQLLAPINYKALVDNQGGVNLNQGCQLLIFPDFLEDKCSAVNTGKWS